MSNNITVKDALGNQIILSSSQYANTGVQTPEHISHTFIGGVGVSSGNPVPIQIVSGSVTQSGVWRVSSIDTGANTIGKIGIQVGGSDVSTGNPVPVIQPTDSRPSSGAISVVDAASTSAAGQNGVSVITGTPTANSFRAQAINFISTARIQITGTWSGTLNFEVSADGGTTWISTNLKVVGTSYIQSSVTGNGVFYGDVAAATNFRVRASAWASGSATVVMDFSVASGIVQVTNPLRLFDNTNGNQNTIKSANTATSQNDTALVVGLHPKSPIPTGANVIGSINQNGLWRISSLNTGANTIGGVTQSGSWSVTTLTGSVIQVQASENHLGIVTGVIATPSANFTRPNNTVAYASGEIVANSTAAGSVTPLSWSAARVATGNFFIRRVRVLKSGTSVTNAQFRLHLYSASPSGIANGDGGTWLTSSTGYLGSFDVTITKAFTDGAQDSGIPTIGPEVAVALGSGQTIYGLLEARAAYSPTALEVFTVILEIHQN